VKLLSWRATSLSGRLYYSNSDGLYRKHSGGIHDECLSPLLDDSENEKKVTEEALVD
jgi:hypothetical protein